MVPITGPLNDIGLKVVLLQTKVSLIISVVGIGLTKTVTGITGLEHPLLVLVQTTL